jgi:hypothetical protein
MGLLDQIIGRLGGHEPIERFARDEAECDDPPSPDFEPWIPLVGAAPPEAVQGAMSLAPAAPARPGRPAESSASSRQ